MTLDADAILERLKTVRPVERQRMADARVWQAVRMPANERMEYIIQHPEYGGSRG